MKTFTVRGKEVTPGIDVYLAPYYHLVIGDGGHKKATWVALGKNDAKVITTINEEQITGVCYDVGVLSLKDRETGKPTGKYLIVAPHGDGSDNRILVCWSVASGYRGSANILADEKILVVARDKAWHSGQGNLGENAEIIAVLHPGQSLVAEISGRRVQETRARLLWNGKELTEEYGDESLLLSDEPEGELV